MNGKNLSKSDIIDEDSIYENMRDDAGDKLYEVLKDTFDMFVNGNIHYYKNSPERFIQHCICILKSITNMDLYDVSQKKPHKIISLIAKKHEIKERKSLNTLNTLKG